MSETYLAVLKALYDYEQPQSDDEIAIKEDQLLFLIEKTDEEWVTRDYILDSQGRSVLNSWWKVKLKSEIPDEPGPSGLVPSAYVEEVRIPI